MKKGLFKRTTLVVVFLGTTLMSWSQTPFTAFAPEIGATTCPDSNVDFLADVFSDLPMGISFSGFTRNVVGCTPALTHYRSSNFTSTSKENAISENRYITWSFSANTDVEFTLSEIALRHERSGAGADNGAIYYSINGGTFEQVGTDFVIVDVNNRDVFTFGTPVSIPAEGTIAFRWYCWRTVTTGTGNTRFKGGADYATGSGIVGTFASTLPSISVNPTIMSNFFQVIGNPSAEQTFVVSGVNLTEDLSINPPSGYELSLTSGTGFTGNLVLSPVAGVLANTTVYVRLNAMTEGVYNGEIEVGSLEVSNLNVTVNGTASLTPPAEIIANPGSLSNFVQFLGTPSDEQSLTVSGNNLASDITLTAPLGFEITLTSGSNFSSSLMLSQTAGIVGETTVFVRLNHNVVGAIFDNILAETAGIDALEIQVSGSVELSIPPNLGVAPTELNPFLQNLGFPSAPQTLTVGGENLNGDIEVVSTGNFLISNDIGGPFTQSVTLTAVAAYVDPTQIFVHLNAASVGNYTGMITISTADVDPFGIELIGETVAPSGTLLYYWHFNNLETPEDVTSIDADYSLVPGVLGYFEYTNPVEGQRDMDVYDFGTLLNAQMGEVSGKAIRVRNPSTDRTLDFYVPTNSASGITFAYAIERSNSGMLENVFSYSIDGTNYITTGLDVNVVEVTTSYQIYTIDFSDIPEVNDNPNFRIRISFNGNTSSSAGNNRIDNITMRADTYLSVANSSIQDLVIYPNPADGIIQIATSLEVNQISIIDLHGRVVLTTNDTIINTDQMDSGMYFMLIETAQGTVQRSFVKK